MKNDTEAFEKAKNAQVKKNVNDSFLFWAVVAVVAFGVLSII